MRVGEGGDEREEVRVPNDRHGARNSRSEQKGKSSKGKE